MLAVRADVDGRDELLFFDGDTFDELPAPQLPSGSVIAAQFHPRLATLAFALNSSKGPSQVDTLAPANGATEAWTKPFAPAGVDPSQFGEQQIARWKSFDGRDISGIVDLPPARFTGKRPVIIDIHGGPEGQATFGLPRPLQLLRRRARHRPDPPERARLRGVSARPSSRSTTA